MKNFIKSLIFALIISIIPTPMRAMEEQLTAENIVRHPKFIILKEELKKIGGSLTVKNDSIRMTVSYKSGFQSTSIFFGDKDFWASAETVFRELYAYKTHVWELEATLLETLRGLCILDIGHRYLYGDQLATEQTEQLPEELQELVLKIARQIE